MSNDPAAGDGVPEPVREWLAGLAEEQGLSGQELLGRLLAADGSGAYEDAGGEELRSRIEGLEASVSELDGDVHEKIRDVRERVIQVKRETDEKAPAEHGHPDLEADVERVDELVESLGRDFVDLDATVDRLDDRIDAVDDRLAAGFENYEEVLEYLVEATDALNDELSTLATATLDLRERANRLARAEARRAAADDLRESALRHGVSAATCESCGESVSLGLLTAPACPHCASAFTELEPKRGFFRSSVFHTGERPALEGDVEGDSPDLDRLGEADEPAPPSSVGEWKREPGTGHRPDDREDTSAGFTDVERAAEPEQSTGVDPSDGSTGGPVRVVSGVGDEYATRLERAGVETVDDLARADATDLAGRTDIPTGRLETLVSRARELADGE